MIKNVSSCQTRRMFREAKRKLPRFSRDALPIPAAECPRFERARTMLRASLGRLVGACGI
jgi:hypothetical protein